MAIPLMLVFPKAIVLTTKPCFNAKGTYWVNASLGGEDNNLRENPYKCCCIL